MTDTTHVPVLIVGGSLVGMSTAMSLGHHGVRTLVVEHHRGTAIHPRAAQVTQRTMEIYREVGIERIIRESSEQQFVQDGAIMAVETLNGRELAYFIANLNEGVRDVSPCVRVFISQSLLEPLLKSRAEALGAELRFATDMVDFTQDASGVTATIRHRDTGHTEIVHADYMIAADGAHSRVRERLGIHMMGRGAFSKSATIYFAAEVEPLLRGRNLSVIYVNHPQLRGFIRVEKPFTRGFLAINALGDPSAPVTDVSTGLTTELAIELVRLALGVSDLPVTIESVMPWDAEANVAERLRAGRILIAGDAAHTMPPNGGFGGNTGVQDGHNLAWKLALVLQGVASPALLDTYEDERLPVGRFTTEQAYSRYVTRTAPYLGTDTIAPVADDLAIELGYAYRSAAICGAEGDARHANPREWHGEEGTRAPHVWLDRDERQSTLDLFGRTFVVLASADGDEWCAAASEAADALGLPFHPHRVGRGALEQQAAVIAAGYGLTSNGAVIVRPDGFVGARLGGSGDRVRVATDALASMLGRPAPVAQG
jgi:putative polyketide hydroxylase